MINRLPRSVGLLDVCRLFAGICLPFIFCIRYLLYFASAGRQLFTADDTNGYHRSVPTWLEHNDDFVLLRAVAPCSAPLGSRLGIRLDNLLVLRRTVCACKRQGRGSVEFITAFPPRIFPCVLIENCTVMLLIARLSDVFPKTQCVWVTTSHPNICGACVCRVHVRGQHATPCGTGTLGHQGITHRHCLPACGENF